MTCVNRPSIGPGFNSTREEPSAKSDCLSVELKFTLNDCLQVKKKYFFSSIVLQVGAKMIS